MRWLKAAPVSGEHRNDLLLHGGGFTTNRTSELFVRGTKGEGALRVDEIHDGLGLREVHFAI
jgi:hypothetical protein